ncbi:MAG: hypothetical protein EON56_03965 [Alphaproteobacteria bacterium]|nr:MAG: hypothetical protein EON56_03965 [Alphaproteobacteria bacterium]
MNTVKFNKGACMTGPSFGSLKLYEGEWQLERPIDCAGVETQEALDRAVLSALTSEDHVAYLALTHAAGEHSPAV